MMGSFPGRYLILAIATLVATTALSQDASQNQQSVEGAQIFKNSCSVCHSLKPGVTKTGPSLSGVLRSPTPASQRHIRSVIANGKNTMPAFKDKLTPQQISALLEFLRNQR